MPIPRKALVNDDLPGCFHVISRCVRRAYLCGNEAEHRRALVLLLVQQAAGAFAVDVLAYAIMSNHLHLVVRTDPSRVGNLTAAEVAARWAAAHPRLSAEGASVAWTAAEIAEKAADAEWVGKTRLRLRSLSWFMKCIKERLARRANQDDRCTGHFGEGRFQSVPLLDQQAVLAAMAYVDLNPIRAKLADRPEASEYTSVHKRCEARRHHQAATLVPTLAGASPSGPEAGLWFAPIERAIITTYAEETAPQITVDDYLTLVDETGRLVREGKRGSIPTHLKPILERLQFDIDAWLGLMRHGGAFGFGSFGAMASRVAEAARRGAKWIIDTTAGLYRGDRPPTLEPA